MKYFVKRIFNFAVAALIALSACILMPPSAWAYATGDDYPYRDNPMVTNPSSDPDYHKDEDKWGFYVSQCTSFAAWCLVSRDGITDFSNTYRGVTFGNARDWGTAAAALLITVDTNPAVGSVAYNVSSNHVSWVAAVDGNNVTVEEYNSAYKTEYNPNGSYHVFNRRTADKSRFTGFIHFEEINPAAFGQTVLPDVGFGEKDAAAEWTPAAVWSGNGHTYEVVNVPDGIAWGSQNGVPGAQDIAKQQGGYLAEINSQAEQDFIVGLLKEYATKNVYWLGGWFGTGTTNTWMWQRIVGGVADGDKIGTPIDYSNWKDMESDSKYAVQQHQEFIGILGKPYSGNSVGAVGQWISENYSGNQQGNQFFEVQNFGFIIEWDTPQATPMPVSTPPPLPAPVQTPPPVFTPQSTAPPIPTPMPTSVFTLGSPSFVRNGEFISADPYDGSVLGAPIMVGNNTMIPVRSFAYAIGLTPGQIVWNGASQTVTLIPSEGDIVSVTVGSPYAVVGGNLILMVDAGNNPVSAFNTDDGRVYLPLRAVANIFGISCDYNNGVITLN